MVVRSLVFDSEVAPGKHLGSTGKVQAAFGEGLVPFFAVELNEHEIYCTPNNSTNNEAHHPAWRSLAHG
jgi:hypothetical protein